MSMSRGLAGLVRAEASAVVTSEKTHTKLPKEHR